VVGGVLKHACNLLKVGTRIARRGVTQVIHSSTEQHDRILECLACSLRLAWPVAP
jgi:hypothetical protein